MSLDTLFSHPGEPVILLIKIGLLILIFMFIVFLLIAIKQIRAMNEILTQHDLFPWIQGTAVGILFATLALFVLTLVIL